MTIIGFDHFDKTFMLYSSSQQRSLEIEKPVPYLVSVLDEQLANHFLVVQPLLEDTEKTEVKIMKLIKQKKLGARKTIIKRIFYADLDSSVNNEEGGQGVKDGPQTERSYFNNKELYADVLARKIRNGEFQKETRCNSRNNLYTPMKEKPIVPNLK